MERHVSRYRYTTVLRRGADEFLSHRTNYVKEKRPTDIFYEVQTGDTLPLVAHRRLGDRRLWWVITDFNDLVDPFVTLTSGQVLRLPSRARLWMEVLR